MSIVKEKICIRTIQIQEESLPEYPGIPSSLQLYFQFCYKTHYKVMCITETTTGTTTIPWSTNNEYSSQCFLSNLDLMTNKYEIFCCHLLHKFELLGIESRHHMFLISRIIDNVTEILSSKPDIIQKQKVLPLEMIIVYCNTRSVPERELILEASRLEFERENYGMVPAAKEWIDRVMNSEKVVMTMEKENCAICYEEIVEIGSVMPCDHVFHKNCIEEWLLRSHLCPLCRYEMPVET